MSTFLTTGALKQDILEINSSSTPLSLNNLSDTIIRVKGTEAQTILLPDVNTLELGIHFIIINDTSGNVTVTDYSSNVLEILTTGLAATFYLGNQAAQDTGWGIISSPIYDQNIKLLGGGTWSWDLASNQLSWSSSAFIFVAGIALANNEISAGSITIASGQVAYVTINKTEGTYSPLSVSVSEPSLVPNESNVVVIVYRDGDDVVVGNSFRLISGQSNLLDQGLSNETQALLGSLIKPSTQSATWDERGSPLRTISKTDGIIDAITSIDKEFDKFFGQLRLIPNTLINTISVTGTDVTTLHNEIISQELGSKLLTFPQTSINFTNGSITQFVDPTTTGAITNSSEQFNLATQRIAQTFLATQPFPVENVILTFSSLLGSDSGTLEISLYSVDVNGKPTGVTLATSAGVYVDGSLDSQETWSKTFFFPTPYTVVYGTQYALVLKWQTAPATIGYVSVLGNNEDSYLSGIAWVSVDNGGTWSTSSVADFAANINYMGDEVGLTFSPYALPVSEYFWYSILIEYSGTNALGQSTARLRIIPSTASNSDPSLAPYSEFPALAMSKPLGLIQVYNNAGNIEVITIRQLISGSGGGSDSGKVYVKSAAVISKGDPVFINTFGELEIVDITKEDASYAFCGVSEEDYIIGDVAKVIISGGVLYDIPSGFGLTGQYGKLIFVSHAGLLTATKPEIGAGDFVSQDFIVSVGLTTKNTTFGTTDLIINPRIIGRLA